MAHINKLYDYTVSAFILHPSEPKICLHRHRKLNKWLQMGGHVELNEDPLEALAHEMQEELGYDESDYEIIAQPDQPITSISKTLPIPFHFEVHGIDDNTTDSGDHKHIDIEYLMRSKRTDFNPQEGESTEIQWLTIKEIQDLYDKGDVFDSTLTICNWIAKTHLS